MTTLSCQGLREKWSLAGGGRASHCYCLAKEVAAIGSILEMKKLSLREVKSLTLVGATSKRWPSGPTSSQGSVSTSQTTAGSQQPCEFSAPIFWMQHWRLGKVKWPL